VTDGSESRAGSIANTPATCFTAAACLMQEVSKSKLTVHMSLRASSVLCDGCIQRSACSHYAVESERSFVAVQTVKLRVFLESFFKASL